MKKLIYIPFLFTIFFAGCNPMDDIYDNIDEDAAVKTLSYTLTSDDYETIGGDIATNEYLSQTDDVDSILAVFLSDTYPTLDNGSYVTLTYNYSSVPAYYSNYEDADTYTLTSDDYALASSDAGTAGGFYSDQDADDYIPTILANEISEPVSDQIELVNYKHYSSEPEIGYTDIYTQDFESDLSDFTAISVTGDQSWYQSSYSEDTYAKMSGYSSGYYDNEDWLISPEIDLTDQEDVILSFNQTAKYVSDVWDNLTVWVSTDFDGSDVSSASWTQLEVPNLPTGDDYTFVESGNIDLSDFEGQKIYIGFKYLSTTSVAATWEIDWVKVQAIGVTGDSDTKNVFYAYSGSAWESVSESAIALSTNDYDAMGESYGEPGYYNNFSSSIVPDNYLPQYLSGKYTYAQEGDTLLVGYKYYANSATNLKVSLYEYASGAWALNDTLTEVTAQYKLSDGEWKLDATQQYTMVTADYQTVVDYVGANIGTSYVDSYTTAESYYGASSYYSEFRTGDSYHEASVFDSWEEAVSAAISTVTLPDVYPTAEVDSKYQVFFEGYAGSMITYSMTFTCTATGVFTYVDDSLTNEE